jgi:hypothetical protein
MSGRVLGLFVVLVNTLAATTACGGGGGETDAGPPEDARHLGDAARLACDADAGCPAASDTPVCDPGEGLCVECVADPDCARPGAYGPRCNRDDHYCVCDTADDCAGNPNGPRCDGVVHACTCIDDLDCDAPDTCEQDPYLGGNVRVCTTPAS